MPPVLPNEQELNLKKRARRRLVGAIVMVILMLIVLPKILQDRAALAPQAAIKISMPETKLDQQVVAKVEAASVGQSSFVAEPETSAMAAPVVAEPASAIKADSSDNQAKLDADKQQAHESEARELKALALKETTAKAMAVKASAVKAHAAKVEDAKLAKKAEGNFAIQVGVYSDAANVQQLQQKLTEAGYISYTEKITTSNGDKIRLRAGKFSSRQEAVAALTKLQQLDLPGMVVSNE